MDTWTDQFSVGVKLKRQIDAFEMLQGGDTNGGSWREWSPLSKVTLILVGGNFNVTLEARDRPKDMGGRDPNLEEF